MEPVVRRPPKKRAKRCLVPAVVLVLLLIIILGIGLGVSLNRSSETFKTTFMDRCQKFVGYDCEKVWAAFEQSYVGKDPCNVPMEAYDPLIAAAPFKPACNRMMFWSKTKDVVHDFTGKKDCFVTLEDTLLGSVLDGLTWCGKEGSSETLTSDCPGWTDCDNNTVRSFWNRVSAAFAEVACGDTTAMLNGSIATPFSPYSIFGSIEVKRFSSQKMRSLNIILVTQEKHVSNCTNQSLKDLQKELDGGIKYNCKEVSEAQIQECSSKPETPCGACW
ncbi:ADP-ribosyl cyclase/cyclic ADP-ribose hydrolase 1-like [Cheilinus undulatus]|uniref:ADP-ribosyl cyclase/cyclic ADP-ribose hydrolase 1-like n=1 Tax=Cheilinus undulatus TaxID=241271 RepID=UPI001BD4EC02|nr:ADP-ribosyl cyclase/cyclic ADP-ribose hydrolase 1-like [Cheilinus undulatus]